MTISVEFDEKRILGSVEVRRRKNLSSSSKMRSGMMDTLKHSSYSDGPASRFVLMFPDEK